MKLWSILSILPILTSVLSCTTSPQEETATATLMDASGSSSSYGYCAQILSKGVYDDKLYNEDYHAKKFMVHKACQTFDSYTGSDDIRWKKECDSSSSSQGGNLGIDLVVKAVPVGIDAGYAAGDSNNYCLDEGTRKSYRYAWYQHMCKNTQMGSDVSQQTHQVLKTVNQGAVEAWRACVTEKYDGLACTGRKAGSGLNFEITYDPSPTGADQIDLSFQTSSNLSTPYDLPESMGRGNLIHYFEFGSLTEPFNVIITGNAQNGGQESCDYRLPAQEEKKCQSGKLVGATSGKVYEQSTPICKQLDACELGRLKGLMKGHIPTYETYELMKQQNQTVHYQNNQLVGIGPCAG